MSTHMAPLYKMTYFPSKALAEVTRLLFVCADIEWEDYRFEREQWPTIKPTMPFGQVPILEYNGKVTHQSVAMARYAAKKAKMMGDNDWEDLEIDSIVDTINDFRGKIANYHYEENEALKESLREPLFKEIIPCYLKKFEEIAKANNGHFALGRLTWADFYWFGMLDYLNNIALQDLTANNPNLKAVGDNVAALPKLRQWLKTRPVTEN